MLHFPFQQTKCFLINIYLHTGTQAVRERHDIMDAFFYACCIVRTGICYVMPVPPIRTQLHSISTHHRRVARRSRGAGIIDR